MLATRAPTFVARAGGAGVASSSAWRSIFASSSRIARARAEADVGEAAGELAVGVERLGVTARGVAGGHQLGDELLAQRVLGDERGQLGGRLVGAAERGERRGARAAQPVADRVQAAGLDGGGVVGEREVGERLAAPQRERLVAEGERLRRRPCRPRPRRGAANRCASTDSGATASR